MVARPRRIGSKDLPTNLYEYGGYFKYLHPKTRKFVGLGRNRKEAIAATIEANALIYKETNLVNKIIGLENSFSNFLDTFITELLPERELKEKTVELYKEKIKHIKKDLGDEITGEITIYSVKTFLKKFPPTQSNNYRSILITIFKYAIAEGLAKENPAEATIKRKIVVKRKRLTLDGFNAIHAFAPMSIKNAMDLALQTLQRREDIANCKFSNIKDNALCIIQHKTGSPVRIKISGQLHKVLSRCRDNIISPYIIHQGFKTNKARRAKQLSPPTITKGFAKARKESRYYNFMELEERPSFHEIRALGADLYRQAGWPENEIQKLLGHKSESETQRYLDRHEIKWVDVECGLNV